MDVLSFPLAFVLDSFPPFYRALLTAWRFVDGSWSSSRAALVFAASSPFHVTLAREISAQLASRVRPALLALNLEPALFFSH